MVLDAIQQWLKIEWVYQETVSAEDSVSLSALEDMSKQTPKRAAADALPDPIPDHEMIRELTAFAEMGYKKGVRGVLDQLPDKGIVDPQHLAQLEALYKSFQFDGIATYLKQHTV